MTDKKDPLDGPVSEQTSTKAREAASKLLDEIHDDPEWEKIMGLLAGNLVGHAVIMIRRHRGREAAQKWLNLTMSVIEQHIGNDPPAPAPAKEGKADGKLDGKTKK